MKKKKTRGNTKGYTLVEVIVVCIILAILIGVAAGGLIAYQRKAIFKKNNEYAQTIFLAAQTALSQAKDSGQSEELTDLIVKDTGNKLTSSMVKNGAKVQMKAAEAENARLYYYIFKKGDIGDAYSDAQKMLFNMIEPYIYDTDILNATFCVEFDPSDGVVYSVLYNDRASDFHYGGGASTEKDNDITDRDSDVRSKILLGYYGVDQLSDQAPGAADKNLIDDVKLLNGETLDLVWTAKDPLQYAYTVRLYSAKTKKIAASLKINDPDKDDSVLKNSTDENAFIKCDLVLYSYDEKGKQSSKKFENVQFRANASVKDGKTICRLVLDAADLKAAGIYEELSATEREEAEKYKDTYSVKRLGIQGTKLYARMRVSGLRKQGSMGKTVVSSWKQTKAESAYLGSEKEETVDKVTTVTGDIKNARHLFNIRFMEGQESQEKKTETSADAVNYHYQQKNDIYWDYEDLKTGQKGLVQNKNLYNGQKTESTDKNFPAIAALHRKNVYSAKAENAEKKYAIAGLHISEMASTSHIMPLGIFRENEGAIESLEVKSSDVTGKAVKYVGMICGINNGTLTDITVDADSKVSGQDYVGGIAGSDVTGKTYTTLDASGLPQDVIKYEAERKYENLTNHADVQGENYIGGITGYVHGIYGKEGKETLTLKKCENTGSIQSTKTTGICIGGIAGYNRKSILEECTSTVVLTEAEKAQLSDDAAKKQLRGYFVGGLVGYDDGGEFRHCISGSKKSSDDYVYGKCYVGGITGFHTDSGNQNVIAAQEQNLTISADLTARTGNSNENLSENNSNVTAEKYAGGIVSVMGALKGDVAGVLKINGSAAAEQIEVEQSYQARVGMMILFTNSGIVAVSDSYAGGIVGFNNGTLIECNTNMLTDDEKSMELLEFAKTYTKDKKQGDYVGGIAGYNNGIIVMTGKSSLFSITAGANYVGGVVGYNDNGKNCSVSTFRIKGGYTAGNNFVGGYMGLNRNQYMSIVQKPSDESSEDSGEVPKVSPNYIEGNLYVGGCVGGNIMSIDGKFNMMFGSVNAVSPGCEITGTAFVGGYIGYNKIINEFYDPKEEIGRLAGIGADSVRNLATIESLVKNEDASADGEKEWVISAGEADQAFLEFAQITARIYAGGVFGYNAGDTQVTLRNIISNTPITTTEYVTEQGKDYSYAGGIAGHVTKKMFLVACRNLAADQIVSPENVSLGGLAELNEGTFENCYVDTIAKGSRNQFGGLAGRNKGTINGCQTEDDVSIAGKNEIGGLVYDNSGTIQNVNFKGVVSGTNATGGIASSNSGVIQDSSFGGNVNGADTTGGITAQNLGQILNTVSSGTVSGSEGATGGITGINQRGGIITQGTALAETGDVSGVKLTGGITGANYGEISDVSGNGNVHSTDEQTGGIAGFNSSTIQNASVNGKVDAKNQTGGITGNNMGSIIGCSTGKDAVVTGTDSTGGITGSNEPVMDGADIKNSENHAAVQGQQSVGGIAGFWSSSGGNSNCTNNKNFGSVQGTMNVGGVIGLINDLRRALTVNNAYNQGSVYGYVTCEKAGGIIGHINGTQYSTGKIIISDAVNVGTVAAGSTNNTAGIVGVMDSNNPTTVKNCRNYGLPVAASGLELALADGSEFSGIIGQGNEKVTLENCFGVSGCTFPISKAEKVIDNGSYYFAEGEEEEEKGGAVEIEDTELVNLVPLHGLGEQDMPDHSQIKNLFDGKMKKDKLDVGNTLYYSPDPKNGGIWPDGEIRIKFMKPVALNSIEIYWYVRAHAYTYSITAYGENGNVVFESGKEQFTPPSIWDQKPSVCNLNLMEKVSKVTITIYDNIYNGGINEICFNGLPIKDQKDSFMANTAGAVSLFSTYSTEQGIGTPLYVEGSNAPYSASNKEAGVSIANGLSSNPLDQAFNSDYSHVTDGAETENLRYQMYSTIDHELIIKQIDQTAYSFFNEQDDSNVEQTEDVKQEEKNEELPKMAKAPAELSAVKAPTVSLADENKDSYLYNVSWQTDYNEEMLAAIEKYIVTVKESSGKKNASEQTYEVQPGQNEMQIDLEAFAGKTVSLSVQAVVKDGTQNYKDSPSGEKTEVQIPQRNEEVKPEDITCREKETDVLSMDDFTDQGIQIQVQNSHQKTNGTYRLHMTVYSDPEKTEVLEDLGEVVMEGSLKESIYSLSGLNPDYAGRYIGIEAKAVSEDKMNSVWSEEKLLKLPMVQLKVPELIEEQTSMTYQEERTSEPEGEIISSVNETHVEQNGLIWNPADYDGAYKIDINAPVSNTSDEQYHLVMTRNTEGDPVTITKLTDKVDLEGNPIWGVLPYVVAEYPDEEDQSLTRVYTYEFQYEREQTGTAAADDGNSYEYRIPLKGYVECHEYLKDGQEPGYTYKLILPDVTSEAGLKAIYGSDFRNYLYTSDVTITAEPEEPERYKGANPLKWWRELDEYHHWITKIEEQKEDSQSSIGK